MDGRAAAMPEPLHSPSGCHGHGTPLVPPVNPSSQPLAADVTAAAPPAWNEEVVDWTAKAPRSPAQEPAAAADARADVAAPSPTPAAATATAVLGERVRGGAGGGGSGTNEVVVPTTVSRSRAGKFADASAAAAARLNYSRATAAAAACQQPVRPVRTPSAGPSAGKRPRVSPANIAAPLPGWNSSTSLRAAAVAAAAANGNGNGADGGGGSRAPPALSSVARRSVSTRVLSHSSPTLPSPRDDPRIVNTQAARKPFSSRSRLGVPGCEAGAGYAAATGASSARAKRGAAAAAAAAGDAPSYLTADRQTDSKDKGSARRSRTTELPAIVSGRGRGVSTGAKEQDGKAGQRLQWFGPPGEVVPGLWVGSMEHASPKAVEKHGFTSVFSIMRYSVFGGPPTYGNAVEFHNYPFCDNGTDSIPFAEIAERINEALAKSMRVLVHCKQGISRSVSSVIAFLCLHKRMTFDESLAAVKLVRPAAAPKFTSQLKSMLRAKGAGLFTEEKPAAAPTEPATAAPVRRTPAAPVIIEAGAVDMDDEAALPPPPPDGTPSMEPHSTPPAPPSPRNAPLSPTLSL
eukprot:Rhum_TRINITY_DN8781_c1_g1::Rhum_TRINITY_DN8781_c1_g1_i1::g.29910::m.29910